MLIIALCKYLKDTTVSSIFFRHNLHNTQYYELHTQDGIYKYKVPCIFYLQRK